MPERPSSFPKGKKMNNPIEQIPLHGTTITATNESGKPDGRIGEQLLNNVTQLPAPPAGFKLEYHCSCGIGCTPDDLNTDENCEILWSGYQGPSVYLISSTGCQVNSSWTVAGGIEFRVSNHGYLSDDDGAEYVEKAWTRAELEALPAMVDRILAKIGGAS